jgi:metallo-beta-lactamase family protein
LPDSGYLQEEEASYANRHGFSKHSPALPLYTRRDAEDVCLRWHPIEYGTEVDLGERAHFRLLPAGHILGAAMLSMRHGGTSLLFYRRSRPPGRSRASSRRRAVDHADF